MPAVHLNKTFLHPLCFALKSYGNPEYLTLFKILKLTHVQTYHTKEIIIQIEGHMQGSPWQLSAYLLLYSMHPRIIYWLAWAVTRYLWIFFTHFWFNINLAKLCSAAAAHVYQINGTPGKIDWDKNRKEDSMPKIQSKSRATSAESHLGLICRYEVCGLRLWQAGTPMGLWGNKQYYIPGNRMWFISHV